MQMYSKKCFVLAGNSSEDFIRLLQKRMDVFYNNPINRRFDENLTHTENIFDNFELIELSNIAHISSGKTPSNRSTGKSLEYDIPLLKTSNVYRGLISINDVTTTFISNKEINESNKVIKNDVLITIVGANLDIVGRTAIYEVDEIVSSMNQNIARIRCFDDKINPKYLMIYLNSKYAQNQIKRISKQGNQVNLNAKEVGEIKILVPHKKIQEEFVLKYERLFDQVKFNEKILETGLDNIYAKLYKKLGLDDFTIPKENKVVVENLECIRFDFNFYNPRYLYFINLLKENKHVLKSIKEISYEVYRGDSPSKYTDNGVPVLQINNLEPFKIIFDSKKYISYDEYNKKPRFQLRENDLLVSGVGPPLGEVCYVKKQDLPLAAYNHITIIRPNEEIINPLFLCVFLNSIYGQMQMKKCFTGVRQIYLTNEWIEKILVPVPSLLVQEKICNIFIHELKKMEDAEHELENNLKTIFDRLFNEHIRIS